MSSADSPWFYSESLSSRFAEDINDALHAGRLTDQQASWLKLLIDNQDDEAVLPQAARVSRGDGGLIHAELAGALLISDAQNLTSSVYLFTPLEGVERFDSRQALVAALTSRFGLRHGDPSHFEYERIEGDIFETLAFAIIDQQAQELQQLSERLQRFPELRTAMGQNLQQEVDTRFPGTKINVLTHVSQIVSVEESLQTETVLATQPLVDVALRAWCGTPLASGIRQRWLDSQGRELAGDQARAWQRAVTSSSGLTVVYERLLTDYWAASTGHNATLSDLAGQAFVGCFRQHLLSCRQDGSVTASEYAVLKSLCRVQGDPSDEVEMSRVSIAIQSQAPLKLAGVVLIGFTPKQLSGLFLYSAAEGLRRFNSVGAVVAHFAGISGRTEIFNYTSLDDQLLLRAQGALHLRLDPVSKTPLIKIADSVIALQKRNLASILATGFNSPDQASVTTDAALDIRKLIDPRLCVAGDIRHWNNDMASSAQLWSSFSSPSRIAALGMHVRNADDPAPLLWATYLRDARMRIDSICNAHPTAADCACQLLNRYFSAAHSDVVDAQRMWFRDEDDSVVSLSVLLIERITGHREAGVSQNCQVYFDSPDAVYSTYVSWLTPDLLNHVLNRAQQAFATQYSRLIRGFNGPQRRVGNSGVVAADASRLIQAGLLRLALSMQRKGNEVSQKGLDMLEQALDRPAFNLREHFGFAAVEVSIPVLVYDSSQPPIPLTNVFVFQQPLGGDDKPLQWSAVLGLREFDNISTLQLDLNARLAYPGSREQWLNLITESDRQKLRDFFTLSPTPVISVNLARVDGDFLQRLVDDEQNRQCLGIEAAYWTAVEWQADAGLLNKMLLPRAADDKARTLTDTLSGQLEYALLARSLPDWLNKASERDLLAFRELTVRFWQLYTSRQRVVSLSSLYEYTVAQVRDCLETDYPGAQLNPDRILVTLTHYTQAPVSAGQIPSSVPAATSTVSESLSDFAINRFSRFQDATLSVSHLDTAPLPASLDAAYVRTLARTLNIGAGYQHYLEEKFKEDAPDYFQRLSQFVEQAPCALLLTAFQMRLQGALTSAGYEVIESLINMPDSIARLPVDGRTIVFSALQLIPAPGYAADVATGIYLIGPENQGEGPWILHAIASQDYIFKEYATQNDFLIDLQTSAKLQALVLERLDSSVRFVYERGGFLLPHLSWATGGFTDLGDAHPEPVQLRVVPAQENFLLCLFLAAQQVMMLIAKRTSVTTAEADRAESRHLLLLGAEQAFTFLPGRVGGLVGLWQAKDLFHSSLDSAKDDQWGKAVAEFAAALLVLITTSQQLGDEVSSFAESDSDSDADELAESRWHDEQIQLDLDENLRPFEVHDVSLNQLEKDDSLSIFKDTVSLKQYAAVAGKVYQVRNGVNGWCVIEGEEEGPLIRLGTDHRWTFDISLGARRNGGALTRFKTNLTDLYVDDVFVVDARGIAEVQRLYPLKATQIVEAHEQASTYLRNAISNLTVRSGRRVLDPRALRIIKEFFGVHTPGNRLVIAVKQAITDVYRALLDPSLSPHSSQRYVVGTNRLNSRSTTAFTYTHDPLKRVFLSDRFFCTPFVRLKSAQSRRGGFNVGAHYRAVALIHEVSHIASKTEDIVYVDSELPFLDLLEDTGTYRARLKRDQTKNQARLSHLTPRDELFRIEEDGAWRDLKTVDGGAKSKVLKLTGASSIDAARDVFLDNPEIRAKVILSNADSIALLVTLLGRERF